MLQQNIFGDRNFKQKLAAYSLTGIDNLEAKTNLISKYIKSLESGRVERTKEEAIQADFLNRFFGEILGYDYNDPNSWNLEKEYKSVTDGTKPDGALGFFTMDGKNISADVRAVVELKDALTDLDKPQNRLGDKRTPVEQAFSYSSKAGGQCKWVIVSNFKEIRFYHASDQSRYEIFHLHELLNSENLKRFFFLLQKERLISKNAESYVDTIYRERQESEQTISKLFYNQYKNLRIELFEHLKKHNPEEDELALLTKSQKLLDRFIFVCFCEKNSLLPSDILKRAKDILRNAFDPEPNKLWRQLKGLFFNIDCGNPPLDINKFNGGLFAHDEGLDNLIIKDEILLQLIKLSEYDFNSDLNVNILGHIFEQSLSDIEELKAQIGNGKELSDAQKSDVRKNGKRKKDGIFYTPEYITRYIVKESVGGWLEDRKRELGFYNLPELTSGDLSTIKPENKKGSKLKFNANVEAWLKFWEAYREQLRNIKVLDPACGSGAFLNQAFDYLYVEGRKVSDEISRLRLGQREMFELDRHILTSNIYGVDLNPESVEITKLSLWLKTANRGKELTALDENIKCGNSLIDDPKIAGERAFNWFMSFPSVFRNYRKPKVPDVQTNDIQEPSYNYGNPESKGYEKFGFDVVIGNPPWGAKLDALSSQYLVNKFPLIPSKIKDTYFYFSLLAINILKDKGYLGIIIPNTWLLINNANLFRKHLLDYQIKNIIDHGDCVFDDAIVESTTLILKKVNDKNTFCETIKEKKGIQLFVRNVDKNLWLNDDLHRIVIDLDLGSYSFIKKIEEKSEPFQKYNDIIFGIKPYQIGCGTPPQSKNDVENRIYHSDLKIDNNWFPLITGTDVARYRLEPSGNSFIKYGKWLMYPSNQSKINSPKLLLRRTSSDLKFVFDNNNYYPQNSIFIITSDKYNLKYLLAILNSSLMNYIYKSKCPQVGKIFAEVKPSIIKSLPVFDIELDKQFKFIEKVDIMLSNNSQLLEVKNKFIELLLSKWSSLNITGKLNSWYKHSFEDFRKELEKQKIKLTLQEQAEWLQYFNEQKQKAEILQQTIAQTDKEIDDLVYQLYELTDDEKAIINS
ncbi:MAG: TaqI-like C-terminal specificity domain-containing protein [Bacteroidota bacterium]|nr:TaqI-like C-terminal specificity domain-containing protein [Bacteroidota bacterium]